MSVVWNAVNTAMIVNVISVDVTWYVFAVALKYATRMTMDRVADLPPVMKAPLLRSLRRQSQNLDHLPENRKFYFIPYLA